MHPFHDIANSADSESFLFCPLLHLYIHIKKNEFHPVLQKKKLLLKHVTNSYSWDFSDEISVGFRCLTTLNSFGNPSLIVLWEGVNTAFCEGIFLFVLHLCPRPARTQHLEQTRNGISSLPCSQRDKFCSPPKQRWCLLAPEEEIWPSCHCLGQ